MRGKVAKQIRKAVMGLYPELPFRNYEMVGKTRVLNECQKVAINKIKKRFMETMRNGD